MTAACLSARARLGLLKLPLTMALCWCVAACHFDSQPLFEPYGATLDESSSDGPRPGDAQVPLDAAEPAADGGDSDAGAAVDSGAGATCKPEEVSACDGERLLLCSADAGPARSQECGAPGCNAAAQRCNVCRPDAVSCSGDELIRCAADGGSSSSETCELGCIATGTGMAACRQCADGPPECQDGNLVQCAPDGQSMQTTRCARGCDDRTHTCNGRLVPTNIPKDACSWTDFADSERDIDEDTTLDTERDCPRVITQGSGLPDLCVLAFERLRVRRGVTLAVTGARALVLLATRSLELEGRISVSARGAEVGAGSVDDADSAGRGGNGAGRVPQGMDVEEWTNLPANAGGGGAGHLLPGARGGAAPGQCGPNLPCAEPGAGGKPYGAEKLVPLQGGSSGGQNSAADWSTRRKLGGGGGGALQLVACEELKLARSAVLDANGGGGEGGFPGADEMDSETPGAGAGGGSGGSVLIQARVLSLDEGARIFANGGGGGGGATRTAEGDQPMVSGSDGQDGQLGATTCTGSRRRRRCGGQNSHRNRSTTGSTCRLGGESARDLWHRCRRMNSTRKGTVADRPRQPLVRLITWTAGTITIFRALLAYATRSQPSWCRIVTACIATMGFANAVSAQPAAAAPRKQVAVLSLESDMVTDDVAKGLRQAVCDALSARPDWEVHETQVSLAQLGFAHDCSPSEATCLRAITEQFELDSLVFGRIARRGDEIVVHLSRFEPRADASERHADASFSGAAITPDLLAVQGRALTGELFDASSAKLLAEQPSSTPHVDKVLAVSTPAANGGVSGRTVAGYALLGAAAVSAGLSVFSFVQIQNAQDDEGFNNYRRAVGNMQPDVQDVCDEVDRGNRYRVSAADFARSEISCNRGHTYQLLQFVFLGSALITGGLGAYLLLGGQSERVQPDAKPERALQLQPRFSRNSAELSAQWRF
jgi:hypothetical protein